MRVIAYGQPANQAGLAASLQGLANLQWETVRKPSKFAGRFLPEPCDFGLVEGFRSWHRNIWQSHVMAGVPIVLIEYGYIARASNPDNDKERFWQVSLNDLGWIPDYPCDGARFSKLGVEIKDWREPDDDKPIIICGDHPGGIDEADDFKWPEIRHWAMTALREIRKHTDRRIFWRPHPAFQMMIPGFNGLSVGEIDWSEQWACVVHNSNTGNEALISGCPVFTDGTAGYRQMSGFDLCEIETPPMPDRQDYFNRLAHGQWLLSEIREGRPFIEYAKQGVL